MRASEPSLRARTQEHTFTELDSLVDWAIVANMSQEYGYWPAGCNPPKAQAAASEAPWTRNFIPLLVAMLALAVAAMRR